MSAAAAAIVGPGGDYHPDRAVSDEDDPDLGAASLADDATGGSGGGAWGTPVELLLRRASGPP